MKPTTKMLRLAEETSPPKRRRSVDVVESLVQRRAQVERALAETRAQQESGEIAKAIDQRLKDLVGEPVKKPAAGAPGTVVVRVVGLAGTRSRKGKAARLPLPGLDVEVSFRNEAVATATTDLAGVAVLELPEDCTGSFEVSVLGPDCKAFACRRGRKTATSQPALLLEVAEQKALAPAFERGRVWTDAAGRASAHAAELKAKLTAALSHQESILAATLTRLDDAITACK